MFSQDLDEYRVCMSLFPSARFGLKGVDFDKLNTELETNSDKHLWKGIFRYEKVGEEDMLEQMKEELKLGNNMRNYDIGLGTSLYTLLGIRRPRLFLPIDEENLRYHQ